MVDLSGMVLPALQIFKEPAPEQVGPAVQRPTTWVTEDQPTELPVVFDETAEMGIGNFSPFDGPTKGRLGERPLSRGDFKRFQSG